MANRERGEVRFEADGAAWTLVFSVNALCAIEGALDVPITEVGAMMGGGAGEDGKPAGMRISLLRTMVWAGLLDHHPEITERRAGELIHDLGMAEAGQLVGKAFVAAFPEAAKGDAGPRKPPAKAAKAGAG